MVYMYILYAHIWKVSVIYFLLLCLFWRWLYRTYKHSSVLSPGSVNVLTSVHYTSSPHPDGEGCLFDHERMLLFAHVCHCSFYKLKVTPNLKPSVQRQTWHLFLGILVLKWSLWRVVNPSLGEWTIMLLFFAQRWTKFDVLHSLTTWWSRVLVLYFKARQGFCHWVTLSPILILISICELELFLYR